MRFILFLVLFYLIYIILKNLVLRTLRKGYANVNAREKQPKNWDSTFNSRTKGGVTISYNPEQTKSKGNNKVGEYVDYEEID